MPLFRILLGGREARTQRYTIGKHGTPDKAREEAERLLGRVANEIDPTKERKAKLAAHRVDAEAPTLAEFADRYIDEYAKPYKKPRTLEEDERNLRLHIKPTLGKLKLKDIAPAHIAKFHASGRDMPTNANRCRALLSHLFKMAEVWGERPPGSNPCRYAEKFRRKQTGAVSLGRRARSTCGRVGGHRRQGATIGHRRDSTSDPHGVPSVGDPVASVGMDPFRARLPDA